MDAVCARCGSPVTSGGTYTTDGDFVCSRCAAWATVSAANATIASAQRDAQDRRQAQKIVGTTMIGLGAIGIAAAVFFGILFLIVAGALLYGFIWVLQHLPNSFNVG